MSKNHTYTTSGNNGSHYTSNTQTQGGTKGELQSQQTVSHEYTSALSIVVSIIIMHCARSINYPTCITWQTIYKYRYARLSLLSVYNCEKQGHSPRSPYVYNKGWKKKNIYFCCTYARGVVELPLPGIASLDEGVPLLGQLVNLTADAASELARLFLGTPVASRVTVEIASCWRIWRERRFTEGIPFCVFNSLMLLSIYFWKFCLVLWGFLLNVLPSWKFCKYTQCYVYWNLVKI